MMTDAAANSRVSDRYPTTIPAMTPDCPDVAPTVAVMTPGGKMGCNIT